jgi:long-chain acyl-CoA synthetase
VQKRLGGEFECFFSGGAHLDPALGQKWEDMGVRVVVGYGTTEAAPVVTANSYEDRDMHSVGRPIASNEVKIAPDGEVLVRGANVFPGYWQDDAATREAFEDGWYKTGDLGELTPEGRLRLKGRKKNMIVLSNGFNVYPEDVEQVLMQVAPELTDVVVVGLEDEGEVDVHAILLTREPERAAEAVRLANRKLAPHQRIKDHTIWPDDDFPRTHTLKAKRQEIVPRLQELRAAPAPTPTRVAGQ